VDLVCPRLAPEGLQVDLVGRGSSRSSSVSVPLWLLSFSSSSFSSIPYRVREPVCCPNWNLPLVFLWLDLSFLRKPSNPFPPPRLGRALIASWRQVARLSSIVSFALPVTLSVTALVTQETVACSKSLTRGCFVGLAPI